MTRSKNSRRGVKKSLTTFFLSKFYVGNSVKFQLRYDCNYKITNRSHKRRYVNYQMWMINEDIKDMFI